MYVNLTRTKKSTEKLAEKWYLRSLVIYLYTQITVKRQFTENYFAHYMPKIYGKPYIDHSIRDLKFS